jgi:quinol monooxygenase YgiN
MDLVNAFGGALRSCPPREAVEWYPVFSVGDGQISCASGISILSPATMLAVVVTISSHPDKVGEMIAALEGNAAHSRHEPECLKWEWSQHIEDPTKFAIYELYTTREAFAAHKASDHFAVWVEASTPCIKEKVAGQYDVKGVDPRPVAG